MAAAFKTAASAVGPPKAFLRRGECRLPAGFQKDGGSILGHGFPRVWLRGAFQMASAAVPSSGSFDGAVSGP